MDRETIGGLWTGKPQEDYGQQTTTTMMIFPPHRDQSTVKTVNGGLTIQRFSTPRARDLSLHPALLPLPSTRSYYPVNSLPAMDLAKD